MEAICIAHIMIRNPKQAWPCNNLLTTEKSKITLLILISISANKFDC